MERSAGRRLVVPAAASSRSPETLLATPYMQSAVAGVSRTGDQAQWQTAGISQRSYALYRSHDGGDSWQPAGNSLPPGPITTLYADPTGKALYAGLEGSGDTYTRRFGLWRSDDDGDHWEQVLLAQDELNVRRITRGADGRYLFVGATVTGKNPTSMVYRSADDGHSWAAFEALHFEQAPGSVMVDLVADTVNPERLLIITEGGQVYLSADAGQSWSLPAEPPEPLTAGGANSTRLAIGPDQSPLMLLVRSGTGVTGVVVDESADRGTSWTRLRVSGLPATGSVSALAALPGGAFLLNTGNGTYRSSDRGRTWQALDGPLNNGDVADFVQGGTAVLAATGYGLFTSRDGGFLWQATGRGLPVNSQIAGLISDPEHPARILALSGNDGLNGVTAPPLVLRSSDGGQTWMSAARGLPLVSPLSWAVDPNDPNSVFVGSYGQLLHSLDGGASWESIPFSSDGLYAVTAIAVAASNSSVVYAGGRPVQRSSDGGSTWEPVPVLQTGQQAQAEDALGLVIDPADSDHVWAALRDGGIFESVDGGTSWRDTGLDDRPINWLVADTHGAVSRAPEVLILYAGVRGDGIYRQVARGPQRAEGQEQSWLPASTGLPERSTILRLIPDPRTPGTLWAARDGGGVYRSNDDADGWTNVAAGMGDNLVEALAIDYSVEGGLVAGTATAGVWALRPETEETAAQVPQAIDARIEIVWPHDQAPVGEAREANLSLRLFNPGSLVPPPCGWTPEVEVWQAIDTEPARPFAGADQRQIDGRPIPLWDLNDVDVHLANDPQRKLYFMVSVAGSKTSTAVWAHSSDPLTYFPQQDVPSGLAVSDVDALDARIQIVWPHDEDGNLRPVAEAAYANIVVELFKHDTRRSVPVGWTPAGLTLYGAWNQEIGVPLAREAVVQVRQSGAVTYPVWEFQNIPVSRAANPANKLYLWVIVDNIATYPTIWTHGADARTFFPVQDEPIQGCMP